MTDEERRSVANLLLLCKPHHDLVDKIALTDYPPELLVAWKTQREGENFAVLQDNLRGVAEERLVELLQEAFLASAPRRSAVLEVKGGVIFAGEGQVATLPLEGWKELLDANPSLASKPQCIVATVRNDGDVTVTVEDVNVYVQVQRPGTEDAAALPLEVGNIGQNLFPEFNPNLPYVIRVGEPSLTWLLSLEVPVITERALKKDARGLDVRHFRVEARLSSGEPLSSGPLPLDALPSERVS